MTAQAAGLYYQSGISHYPGVHDIEEKHDNGTKEFKKVGDAVVSGVMPGPRVLVNKSAFRLSQVIIISAPDIDHLAPPPDTNFVC